jgi:DNA-binding IclR family transcriptional regulator
LHATALGKAMLAEFSEERVQAIVDRHGLEPVTANTITDEKELFESLADVRERGYALDRGEHHEEIRSVAAPVTDRKGTVEGAVSISAPASRMKGDRFHTEVPNMVTNAANLIEINITYP